MANFQPTVNTRAAYKPNTLKKYTYIMKHVPCPGGMCPPSFIHHVIIITGLNQLLRCQQDVKPPLKTQTQSLVSFIFIFKKVSDPDPCYPWVLVMGVIQNMP